VASCLAGTAAIMGIDLSAAAVASCLAGTVKVMGIDGSAAAEASCPAGTARVMGIDVGAAVVVSCLAGTVQVMGIDGSADRWLRTRPDCASDGHQCERSGGGFVPAGTAKVLGCEALEASLAPNCSARPRPLVMQPREPCAPLALLPT
jgi:hypothetical protein